MNHDSSQQAYIFIESAISMQFPASYSNIFTVNRTVMHDDVD